MEAFQFTWFDLTILLYPQRVWTNLRGFFLMLNYNLIHQDTVRKLLRSCLQTICDKKLSCFLSSAPMKRGLRDSGGLPVQEKNPSRLLSGCREKAAMKRSIKPHCSYRREFILKPFYYIRGQTLQQGHISLSCWWTRAPFFQVNTLV